MDEATNWMSPMSTILFNEVVETEREWMGWPEWLPEAERALILAHQPYCTYDCDTCAQDD